MIDFLAPALLLSEAAPYLTLGGAGWLAWRLVRAYERRAVSPARLRALAERVRHLEATVARMEGSMAQATEAHRLTATLLATRAALGRGDARE